MITLPIMIQSTMEMAIRMREALAKFFLFTFTVDPNPQTNNKIKFTKGMAIKRNIPMYCPIPRGELSTNPPGA